MAGTHRIGLDNSALQGRLRQPSLSRKPIVRRSYLMSDFVTSAHPSTQPVPLDATKVLRQNHQELSPLIVVEPTAARPIGSQWRSKLQLAVFGLAAVVFVVGMTVSLQTVRTNHDTSAQAAALSKRAATASNDLPDTTRPSNQAVSQYVVAPDLPRYLKIPKLGVSARIMQAGVNTAGALDTPKNVYDTAWYTGSAKPGLPGAALIDGHVSSWTTPGVFHDLDKLVSGDQLQITRGDGAVFNYRVVKRQVYNVGQVDMQAALTPITAGKPGLNLISCTGQVIKGTGRYSQRVIVFAAQE
jgi:sortase (surface protein transpeptidase)